MLEMYGWKCMITKLFSMVDDMVGGRVGINKTVIGIGVQLVKVFEHSERLLAAVPGDVIDGLNTATGISGQTRVIGQCGRMASLGTHTDDHKLLGIPFIVECLCMGQPKNI